MKTKPDLFYGFMGWTYNSYMDTPPHNGYYILHSWAKDFATKEEKNPLDCERSFVFTSNVDGHFRKAGFDKVAEIHGCKLRWHCSVPRRCEKETFGFDLAFRFPVDPVSRELPKEHHPICKFCKTRNARPNCMLFYDQNFFDATMNQYVEYNAWKTKMLEICNDKSKKVVVIELGCGTLIPTVRAEDDSFLLATENSTLIRINPDALTDACRNPEKTIRVPSGALAALERINAFLQG